MPPVPPGLTTMSHTKTKLRGGKVTEEVKETTTIKLNVFFFCFLEICVDTNLQELNILHKQEKRY